MKRLFVFLAAICLMAGAALTAMATEIGSDSVTGVQDGMYYVDGEFSEVTGLVPDAQDDNLFWYVKDGSVDSNFTGIAKRLTDKTWWYATSGQLDEDFTGIAKRPDNETWWYVSCGRVDFGYNGMAKNGKGIWYVRGGKVRFDITDVVKGNGDDWFYVKKGKVASDFTGIAQRTANKTWWYIHCGQVDFGYNGFAENSKGIWYVRSGKVRNETTNVVRGSGNDWFYVKKGKVASDVTGIVQRTDNKTWWYVKKGQVDFGFTGVAKRPDNETWWYVKKGKVDFGFTGIAKRPSDETWWYVKKGQLSFDYSGLVENSKGVWYVKQSKVDFSFSGNYKDKGSNYVFKKGKLQGTLRKIDPNKPMIALTYDDGPYSPVTNRILKALKDNGGVCTFFWVGNRVSTYESSVKSAFEMGCQVANHTWDHTSLTTLNSGKISSEISQCNSAIKKITGLAPSCMRPVGGAVNSTVKETVGIPMILWSIDTEDWKSRNATSVYNRVIGKVKDGDIVLMHDLYDSTASASESIIPKLVNQGYQLVTIDELAYFKGYSLAGHKTYSSLR